MKITCLALFLTARLFGQSGFPLPQVLERETAAAAQIQAEASAQQFARKDLAERFNALVQALAAFSEEYNRKDGAVWPYGHAEKVVKAWRKLEQADGWMTRKK